MNGRVPSSEEYARNQQIQARELEKLSTALIDSGVHFVKKNPVPTGLYLVGILICLFFRKSKGWFTCNSQCQSLKVDYDIALQAYNFQRSEEERIIADAKSSVGIFSSFGVEETRGLFWTRFANGREFAQRQTKYDALFQGITAMAKNESLSNYLLRLCMSMLFNFTIGIFGAVVAFIFNLYGLVQTYRANIFVSLIFFFFAAVASIAFAMTWIIGLYVAAAGTVYVGSKVVSNMQLGDIAGGRGGRLRRD